MKGLVDYGTDSDSDSDSRNDTGSGDSSNDSEKFRAKRIANGDLQTKKNAEKRKRGETEDSDHDANAGRSANPKLPPPQLPVSKHLSERSGREVKFVEGNWSTIIFVSIKGPPEFYELVESVILAGKDSNPALKPVTMANDGLHISLSRTVFLKIFQIDRFIQSLETLLARHRRFNVSFAKLNTYLNDDKSRSFISMDIGAGTDLLLEILKDVDSVLRSYKKETFYEDPKFHASICWAPGENAENRRTLDALNRLVEGRLEAFTIQYRANTQKMDFTELYKVTSQLCTFSPDGQFIGTAVEHRVVVRDAETLQIIQLYNCTDIVQELQWSPDSELLLCSSFKKGVIQIFQIRDPQWTASIDEGIAGLTAVRWAPDSRHILSFSDYQLRITIWSLVTKAAYYVQYPKYANKGFAFRKDGRYFALAERKDAKDTVSVYDCESWSLIKHFPVDTSDLEDLAWSPNGRFIAVWESLLEYNIIIYHPDGRKVASYSAYNPGLGLKSLHWSASSQFIALGSYDEKVRLLCNLTWTPLIEFTHPTSLPFPDIAVYRESSHSGANEGSQATGWVSMSDKRTKLYYEKIRPPVTIQTVRYDIEKPNPKKGVGLCQFSCNGRYLATRNDNMPNTLWIWDILHVSQVALIQHLQPIKSIHWNPIDPEVLAINCGNGHLYLWSGPSKGCELIEVPARTMDRGIVEAYLALGVMALIPIYFGSYASLKIPTKRSKFKAISEDSAITESDAKWYPVIGSATLFSMYLIIKFVSKDMINLVLTAHFVVMGIASMFKVLTGVSQWVAGKEFRGTYLLTLKKKGASLLDLDFGLIHIVLAVVAAAMGGWYAYTKHWIVSNLIGESLSIGAIQLLNLDSFKTGIVLLSGLFLYDIFWVFGTEVMVTVAKGLDAPIKVVWPKNMAEILQQGLFEKPSKVGFSMLGLGDIVIPGIFVALCLQYDHYRFLKTATAKTKYSRSFPTPYFTSCFIMYILGLVTTVAVMHTFQAAQPALLYLSPACILAAVGVAFFRGELKELFEFTHEGSPASQKTAKEEEAANAKTPSTPRSTRRRRSMSLKPEEK
ncbi:WD repeat-containing protein wrap73 [Chytridiales sp. JEL 0842]|nr:WD repeat-containing protein wrap73 [Chytridiales sp. JEL 0842]